jgi:hypothetical protein
MKRNGELDPAKGRDSLDSERFNWVQTMDTAQQHLSVLWPCTPRPAGPEHLVLPVMCLFLGSIRLTAGKRAWTNISLS